MSCHFFSYCETPRSLHSLMSELGRYGSIRIVCPPELLAPPAPHAESEERPGAQGLWLTRDSSRNEWVLTPSKRGVARSLAALLSPAGWARVSSPKDILAAAAALADERTVPCEIARIVVESHYGSPVRGMAHASAVAQLVQSAVTIGRAWRTELMSTGLLLGGSQEDLLQPVRS